MFGSSSESLVRSKNLKPASEQFGYPFVKTAIQENDAPTTNLDNLYNFFERQKRRFKWHLKWLIIQNSS